jgi:hypothetical protein
MWLHGYSTSGSSVNLLYYPERNAYRPAHCAAHRIAAPQIQTHASHYTMTE